jgi:molybdenum-dependent DNA-binding transcriptional regulator ModE
MDRTSTNLIERTMVDRQKGGRKGGSSERGATMMRTDRTIGGRCAQMLERLNEVGTASRIEGVI